MSDDKPKLASVKTLYKSNARRIPEMMRKLASEVETPPVKGVTIDQAVCIIRDSKTGRLNIYGWGDINIDASLSLLAQTTRQLAAIANAGNLWTVNTDGMKPKDPTDVA